MSTIKVKSKPKRTSGSKSPYKYHFFKGNVKVGDMLTWSKLAGSGTLMGCKGSCGKYCTGCYDAVDPKKSSCYVFKSYVQYKEAVIGPHVVNTMGMRNEMSEVFEQLDLQLSRMRKVKPVRIHASGEIESAEELKGWFNLAVKHPSTPFYVYTKAYDVLDEVLPTTTIPSNFFINVSIWHDVGINCYEKYKSNPNVRAFVYDDGYAYPASLKFDCHCPAYDAKGKMNHDHTCDKCKICFQSGAKVCACYDH